MYQGKEIKMITGINKFLNLFNLDKMKINLILCLEQFILFLRILLRLFLEKMKYC